MDKFITKVNVVIPVYNEGKLIISTIVNIQSSLKKNYLIQICFDHNSDNTISAIKSSNLIDKSTILFTKNKYFGPHGAVMTGLKNLNAQYHIVIPADDDINSKKLHLLIEEAKKGFDIVCPSRFMSGGKMTGAPLLKAFINRLVNFILYYLAGLPTSDSTNGFRLFSFKVINNIRITSKYGFTYSLEYLIKGFERNYNITQVPSIWIERNAGKSRFMLSKWWLSYLFWFILGIKVGLLKKVRIKKYG